MINNNDLQFLQQRIKELRSALFFSESNDPFKMPVSIVTALKADDEGMIWFYINRPTQSLDAFKKEFPVHLDFFRKGKNYSLKVNGRAFITEDEQNTDTVTGGNKNPELLLVKVKMIRAEYFEREPEDKSNVLHILWNRLYNWFFAIDPSYRPYSFNEEGIAVA